MISAFILILSVTGIALNHAQKLGLYETKVEARWLLDGYGMNPESPPINYTIGSTRLLWLENALFFNGKRIADTSPLKGGARTQAIIIAATAEELILLTPAGEIVERLNGPSIPSGNIQNIALGEGKNLLVKTSAGLFGYDESILDFSLLATVDPEPIWSAPSEPKPDELEIALQYYRGEGLSLYRIILDIHSGRLFTRLGPWMMDIAALGLIALTLSGIYYAMKVKER
jgi:hypothetical protein